MKLPWEGKIGSEMSQLKYEVKSYPDGSKYVELIRWGSEFTYRINSYEDLWILNQINNILKRKKINCTLIIPNLLDAQADRRFADNQPHALKLVCKFLDDLTQFDEIKIFHPHNPEVVEALIDRVEIVDNFEFIGRVLSYGLLKENETYNPMNMERGFPNLKEDLVILLPDGGAYKWGVKLADKLGFEGDVLAAAKNRKFIDGHSKLIQLLPDYDFTGKSVLIVDDISVGGGTFKGLAKMLKERNCGKLYLAVSHMTVESLGQNPVTDYFDRVFTTNSKFDTYYGRDDFEPKNLKVIDLFK